MPRISAPLEMSEVQQRELERLSKAPTTPQRVVRRARIVLARAAGRTQLATAAELGASRTAVIRWERRFAALGVEGLLKDAPGRGRKASIPDSQKAKVITEAMQPPPNQTRWSVRYGGWGQAEFCELHRRRLSRELRSRVSEQQDKSQNSA